LSEKGFQSGSPTVKISLQNIDMEDSFLFLITQLGGLLGHIYRRGRCRPIRRRANFRRLRVGKSKKSNQTFVSGKTQPKEELRVATKKNSFEFFASSGFSVKYVKHVHEVLLCICMCSIHVTTPEKRFCLFKLKEEREEEEIRTFLLRCFLCPAEETKKTKTEQSFFSS
jgi:hypothetical protein